MMVRTRRSVLGAVGGAILVAGCVGDGDDSSDDGTGGDSTGDDAPSDGGDTDGEDGGSSDGDGSDGEDGEASETVAVQVREHGTHGEILVGPDGLTLYMFDSDEQGAGASTCYDGCAENWPPLTVDGEVTAGEGVASELSTFEREDGTMQVAINGWPLYYFANDGSPGDAEGQGLNDVWWVLDAEGVPDRGGTESSEDNGNDGPDY